MIEAEAAQDFQHAIVERQVEREMKSRMLRFRVDADRAAALRTLLAREDQDLLERRTLVAPVVFLRTRRVRLNRPQGPDLCKREIACEECRDLVPIENASGAALCELRMRSGSMKSAPCSIASA